MAAHDKSAALERAVRRASGPGFLFFRSGPGRAPRIAKDFLTVKEKKWNMLKKENGTPSFFLLFRLIKL
jgi:hypothetical protein